MSHFIIIQRHKKNVFHLLNISSQYFAKNLIQIISHLSSQLPREKYTIFVINLQREDMLLVRLNNLLKFIHTSKENQSQESA